jgi:sialate O-acetylesterase
LLKRVLCAAVFMCVVVSWAAGGELTVAPLFQDHMVLQRDTAIPVWGTADPDAVIVLRLAGKDEQVTADHAGVWMVRLPELNAGGPHTLTVTSGTEALMFTDILIGDVWVCSGQSNMEWPVAASRDPETEIAAASYPEIRIITVAKKTSQEPLGTFEGTWSAVTPESIPSFSAVAYYFGRELQKELGVPVGLINTSWGGTPAESWTSHETIAGQFSHFLEHWEGVIAAYPDALKQYEEVTLKEWEARAEKARSEGQPEPPRPWPPQGPDSPGRPSSLYNGMIAPLVPYAIKGAIWYQGESNAGDSMTYRRLFPDMITNWREAWGQGDFPFLFVQLANFTPRLDHPQPVSDWAGLREAQLMTLSLPNTGMAVTIDIGDAADIHPKNKQDVGKRLALAALKVAFDKDVVYSGPIFHAARFEGDTVVLSFDHTDGGLECKGDRLTGFAIAGEDKVFHWADAEIEGDTVLVRSVDVSVPAAVRYGWAENPECNLYNGAGLPASPFRTDDWWEGVQAAGLE